MGSYCLLLVTLVVPLLVVILPGVSRRFYGWFFINHPANLEFGLVQGQNCISSLSRVTHTDTVTVSVIVMMITQSWLALVGPCRWCQHPMALRRWHWQRSQPRSKKVCDISNMHGWERKNYRHIFSTQSQMLIHVKKWCILKSSRPYKRLNCNDQVRCRWAFRRGISEQSWKWMSMFS